MKTRTFGLAALAAVALLSLAWMVAPDAAQAAVAFTGAAGLAMAWVPVVGASGQIVNFPFTHTQLTDTINVLPNQFGMLDERGFFPDRPSSATVVEITISKFKINVLPVSERGAPARPNTPRRGDKIWMEIPHIKDMSVIKPSDIQDMLSLTNVPHAPMTFEEAFAQRLEEDRLKHDLTLEFMRMGALRGQIYDGELTLVHDLFEAFQVTKKEVDFELDDEETDVQAKCAEVISHVRANLKGEIMTGVESFVDPAFFNALVSHPRVEKFWVNWQAAANMANPERRERGGQYGRVFEFGNILFQEYDAVTEDANGDPLPMIAEGEGHAYPAGTRATQVTHLAPADDIRFVNQPGRRIYMSPEILKHGQGIELQTQSNPLPIWNRPATLVFLKAS